MLQIATSSVTLRCVLLRFRFHNGHLHEPVKKDFRRLQEKISREVLTGDEPHKINFKQKTPPDIQGAVPEVEVS